jgi:hypothetical protein
MSQLKCDCTQPLKKIVVKTTANPRSIGLIDYKELIGMFTDETDNILLSTPSSYISQPNFTRFCESNESTDIKPYIIKFQ